MTARELITELMKHDIDDDVRVPIAGHLFQVDALDLSADKRCLIISLTDWKIMEFISDGWEEELLAAIDDAPLWMSGGEYTSWYKAGLRKALDILNEHI